MEYFDVDDILSEETVFSIRRRTKRKKYEKMSLWCAKAFQQRETITFNLDEMIEKKVKDDLLADPITAVLCSQTKYFYKTFISLFPISTCDKEFIPLLKNALSSRITEILLETQYLVQTEEAATSREFFWRLDSAEKKIFMKTLKVFKETNLWEKTL